MVEKEIFSNGTEYQMFLEAKCGNCSKYVDFWNNPEGKDICVIEEDLSVGSLDESMFPFDKVYREKGKWTCKEFEQK